MRPFELEIIACTIEDALAAWRGGAHCLEITVSLDQAGLTPPVDLVRQIVNQVRIPARAMLRETASFTIQSDEELATLRSRAAEFSEMGVEGFVAGFVKDGSLDLEVLASVVTLAPSTPVTVHNAIEQTSDPLKALSDLRGIPQVDRALVRAGTTVQERIERLPEYTRALGPGKELILGGDLKLEMLQQLRHETSVRVFHLGRAVRTPETPNGAVDEAKVRKAVEILSAD